MKSKSAAVFKNTKTGIYLIHSYSRLLSGLTFASPPFYFLSANSEPDFVVQKILSALEQSRSDISPDPTEEEIKANSERMSTELGLKKGNSLYKNMLHINVHNNFEEINFYPLRNLGRRYMGYTTDEYVSIPATSNRKQFYAAMEKTFKICIS